MSIEPGTTILNGEDYTCIWEDIVNKEKKLWQVRLKIYHKDTGEYHEEFHQETGYKIAELREALQEAGFQDVDIYNAYTFTAASDNDNRVYFVALKNRTRPAERPVLRLVKNLKWGVKDLSMVFISLVSFILISCSDYNQNHTCCYKQQVF